MRDRVFCPKPGAGTIINKPTALAGLYLDPHMDNSLATLSMSKRAGIDTVLYSMFLEQRRERLCQAVTLQQKAIAIWLQEVDKLFYCNRSHSATSQHPFRTIPPPHPRHFQPHRIHTRYWRPQPLKTRTKAEAPLLPPALEAARRM